MSDKKKIIIGELLKNERESRSLSIEEVSELSGIRSGRLEDIETEDSAPASIYEVIAIAKAYHLCISQLTGELELIYDGSAEEGKKVIAVVSDGKYDMINGTDALISSNLLDDLSGLHRDILFSCNGFLPKETFPQSIEHLGTLLKCSAVNETDEKVSVLVYQDFYLEESEE